MTKALTQKQYEALKAIEHYIQVNGMPPTLSELQLLLGVTSNQAIINYLTVLEEKGYIERKKTARGIYVIKTAVEDEEKNTLLNLLADLAAQKKSQGREKVQKYYYPSPFTIDEQGGQIIMGSYNDEQY